MIAAALMVGWLGSAVAAEPLTLDTVLASVDAHAPKLAAMAAKLEEAEAKVMAAQGAFDPKLKAKVLNSPTGPYPRLQADTALTVATPYGPEITAGYRIGAGTFPSYYGAYETLDLGEVRVEIATPLLQDLGLTAERAKRLTASHDADAARAARDDVRQRLLGKAAMTYWKWVASGEKLALTEELLTLAEARQSGIEAQVRQGGLPELEAVDNRRVVLTRRAEVQRAEQDLVRAAVALSLYYRDDALNTMVPERDQLPGPTPQPLKNTVDETTLIESAWRNRPDLAVLRALTSVAQVERQRAWSTVLPELDGSAMLSQDQGDGYNDKLGKPEVIVGLNLEVPLLARKGRGELSRTAAALTRLEAETRRLRDLVSAEVIEASRTRTIAQTEWTLALDAMTQASRVADMERRAFQLGASDIFKVTKREETVAKARKAEIEARLAVAMTDAALTTMAAAWD